MNNGEDKKLTEEDEGDTLTSGSDEGPRAGGSSALTSARCEGMSARGLGALLSGDGARRLKPICTLESYRLFSTQAVE
jgi:hypothetical protein